MLEEENEEPVGCVCRSLAKSAGLVYLWADTIVEHQERPFSPCIKKCLFFLYGYLHSSGLRVLRPFAVRLRDDEWLRNDEGRLVQLQQLKDLFHVLLTFFVMFCKLAN